LPSVFLLTFSLEKHAMCRKKWFVNYSFWRTILVLYVLILHGTDTFEANGTLCNFTCQIITYYLYLHVNRHNRLGCEQARYKSQNLQAYHWRTCLACPIAENKGKTTYCMESRFRSFRLNRKISIFNENCLHKVKKKRKEKYYMFMGTS
jgi:hypothetical protein